MENKKIEKWSVDKKTSLNKFIYKSDDVDFEAFFLPEEKVQPIFILDYKTTEQILDPILIINPDRQDPEKKWDKLLSEKYHINSMDIRPKENNKYLKLDIIYKGLNLYRDYIEMPDKRISQKIEHNKLSQILIVCKERLDFLNLDLKRAIATTGTSTKTLKTLEEHLERVKTRLKKIEENPKIDGFTEKEEKERNKIFELEDKIKSAKRRIKRAEKRENANKDKIEVLKTQIHNIEQKLKGIDIKEETIQPSIKTSKTTSILKEKLNIFHKPKEEKPEEINLKIDTQEKKDGQEISLKIDSSHNVKDFATKEDLKEAHHVIKETKSEILTETKGEIERNKEELDNLKLEVQKVSSNSDQKEVKLRNKNDRARAFNHLVSLFLLLILSGTLFAFLNKGNKEESSPKSIEKQDLANLKQTNRLYVNKNMEENIALKKKETLLESKIESMESKIDNLKKIKENTKDSSENTMYLKKEKTSIDKKSILKVIIPERKLNNPHEEEKINIVIQEKHGSHYVEEPKAQNENIPLSATAAKTSFSGDIVDFKNAVGFDNGVYLKLFDLMKKSYETGDLKTFKLYSNEIREMNEEWEYLKEAFIDEYYYIVGSDEESLNDENYLVGKYILDSYIESFQKIYNNIVKTISENLSENLLKEMKLHTVNPYKYKNANKKVDLLQASLKEINLKQQ